MPNLLRFWNLFLKSKVANACMAAPLAAQHIRGYSRLVGNGTCFVPAQKLKDVSRNNCRIDASHFSKRDCRDSPVLFVRANGKSSENRSGSRAN